MNTRQFLRQLAIIRQKLAVKTVKYNGKSITVDDNIQTLLGILRTIPSLKTTGSCGGHKHRHGEWWRCSQPNNHWFVSFRASKPHLTLLQQFANANHITFAKGKKDKLPLCNVCDSEGEKTWYGLWGTGNPNRIAAKLQRFLLTNEPPGKRC